MTKQEEEYVHFVSCIDDLNNAWRTLNEVKNHNGHSLVNPAFQFALVEYSKPYRTSYGVVLNSKGKPLQHKLDDSRVPSAYIDLHNRLLAARDNIHAHSDLTVRDAKLYISQMPGGRHASVAQNVIHGTQELSNIDLIIDLIEQTLVKMYAEVEILEGKLPVNDCTV